MNIPWATHINLSHNHDNIQKIQMDIKFDEDMKEYENELDDIFTQCRINLDAYGPVDYYEAARMVETREKILKNLQRRLNI